MNIAELLHRSVTQHPGRVALTMGPATLTYRELWAQSTRLAQTLGRLGVGRGDRVMLYADNDPAVYVTYLATVRLGGIFTPVHSSFQARELEYVLTNCEPSVLIAQADLVEPLGASAILRNLLPGAVLDLDDVSALLDPPASKREVQIDQYEPSATVTPDSPALISYTSGSTSTTPTPVTRSHTAEVWNAKTYARVWDIRSDDQVLIPLPLSWVYGLSTVGLAALSVGATIVLQSVRETEALLPAIEKHAITLFAGTMTMYSRLLGELQESHHDHSSLRRLYVGGEPVVMPIVKLVEHYTQIRPLQAYATTEVAPVLSVDALRDVSPPDATVGRLVEGSAIRLVDADGQDAPKGEVGEAWLRGKGSMIGYWNEPSMTASRVTEDGWYRSGDFLWRDSDGYYFVAGRGEDVIFREGAKVAVAEVEAALAGIDGIEDAVVVAVPDTDFGEAAIAFVVPDKGTPVSIDTIYDELGSRIARFKLPREIYVLNEFPLGFTGKRDRRHLRELARSEATRDGVVVTMADWLAGQRPRGAGS